MTEVENLMLEHSNPLERRLEYELDGVAAGVRRPTVSARLLWLRGRPGRRGRGGSDRLVPRLDLID